MSKTNIILLAVVAMLCVLCVSSVYAPIRFDKERARRETVVKQRLMAVRTAAERYRHDHGAYTSSWATLIAEHYVADSLQYIPYSNGKTFRLAASAVTTRSGRSVSVMECSATYDEYLEGLDNAAIKRLNTAADNAGRFGGLKIGDLATDNGNAGNWE